MSRVIVVSSDSHAAMPSELWTEYLDRRFHEHLPQIQYESDLYSGSVMALANLPSGEGIPSLIRLAQEAKGSPGGVALEALGQVAIHSAEASAALVEMARDGKFSDYYWLSTVAALGGEQCFITDTGLDNGSIPAGSGLKSYHLEASNQNFYSLPAPGGMSPEQIDERVAIIDRLLAIHPSAAVVQALQNTRASLLRNGQQASAN